MILIFGPPGSGKGTQAEMLQSTGMTTWFSVGEILRRRLSSDDEDRKKMNQGILLDDELIAGLIREEIDEKAEANKAVMLDGYPRSLEQIDWLFSPSNPRHVQGIIELVAPEEKLVNRLLKRAEIEGRKDDNIETIKHRFEVYRNQSQPAIEKLRKEGIPIEQVNADQTVEEVFEDSSAALRKLLNQ